MAESTPQCFSELWNPRDAECAGGYDPAYTARPDRTRSQCAHFRECGVRMSAKRMEEGRKLAKQQAEETNLIPAVQLLGRGLNSLPPRDYGRPQPTVTAPTPPAAPAHYPQQLAAPPMLFNPQMYAPMPVNYSMPHYLTTPEPYDPEEGFWPHAARTIGRSAVKGLAHGLAALMDTMPWSHRK